MSSNLRNGHWVVASYPEEDLSVDNFEMKYEDVQEPGEGEFLIKTTALVMSPPLRMAVGTGGITGNVIPVGTLMRGSGQGIVVSSKHPGFAVGDRVAGPLGWQEYAISDGATKVPVEKISSRSGQPITANLHVMGSSGATAYFGVYDIAKPKIGDVMLVSAAAGSVGSLVVQLGKLSGCTVIGLAGSRKKCDYLIDELKIDAVINYREEDVAARLKEICPHGINIYFDNVGGELLDVALDNIAPGARVVLCGATSQYEGDANWYGPSNYFNLVYKEATMQGFFVFSYANRFPEAYRRIGELVSSGQLKYLQDEVHGIENVPAGLVRVLGGENFGTQIVTMSEE